MIAADERAEILRAWPEAVWFPGDKPPVGQRVLHITASDRREPGTILGRYVAEPKQPHDCPSCRCAPLPPTKRGCWLVRLDDWWEPTSGPEVAWRASAKPRPPDARDHVIVAYPPSLVPA